MSSVPEEKLTPAKEHQRQDRRRAEMRVDFCFWCCIEQVLHCHHV